MATSRQRLDQATPISRAPKQAAGLVLIVTGVVVLVEHFAGSTVLDLLFGPVREQSYQRAPIGVSFSDG